MTPSKAQDDRSDPYMSPPPKRAGDTIMQFHNMTYMTMPLHKNPYPGGHEIYNFGRPFLGHHYYIPGLSDQYLGVGKKIFKEVKHFFHFLPQNYFPFRWGSFTISCVLTLQMLQFRFIQCIIPQLKWLPGPFLMPTASRLYLKDSAHH